MRAGQRKCLLRSIGTEPVANNNPNAVASTVGGSACPQADDTRARGIALGTTRSTINALRAAHTTATRMDGFTLAELVVTVGVLVLLVLLFTQLLNTAANVTTLGHKQMGADSEARQLLDRMAIDFAQMVKRSDVDFFGKTTTLPMTGNDQIAFYSTVPGYYPPTGAQSPVSLVAYRINSDATNSAYNKMERMGKGLVWNGVSTTDTPVVFIPIPVASPLSLGDMPTHTPTPTPTPAGNPAWPKAGNMEADPSYELVGPQVFRFEYYYMLKT